MLPPTLSSAPAAAINHVLATEQWAREKLAVHVGKVACFDLGLFTIALQVDADGLVHSAAQGVPPRVTIRVKPADLPLIAQNRQRAFSYVVIDGDADFANTISQLSQSLRWDFEHDLSRVIGDIASARVVAGARSALRGVSATHRKLTETTAEYFLEENPMLMRAQSVRSFVTDVAQLRDDVARIAKRVERLKGGAQ